jgi:hypothetical protein
VKINGKTVTRPEPTVVVIPRGQEEFVFQAQAVTDFEEFERLCPQPEPGMKMLPGGAQVKNTADPKYQKLFREWQTNRSHWMILTSLSATDGLEWSKVKMDDPETWKHYIKELEDAGFSAVEVAALMDAVTDANGLNQRKIDEATKRFLATMGAKAQSASSPSTAQQSTPSGTPANASA